MEGDVWVRPTRGGGMISGKQNSTGRVQQFEADVITPKVTLGDDGILRVDFSRYDRITLASMSYAHAQHVALSPEGKIPVLITAAGRASVEYKAQRYLSSPEVSAGVSAGAIVGKYFLERHLDP